MNWISEHITWLFCGVGGLILVGVVGWLIKCYLIKAPVSPSLRTARRFFAIWGLFSVCMGGLSTILTIIVDRSGELSEWVEILRKVHKRKIQIFAYANNHYAGHAPATVDLFRDVWRSRERVDPVKPRRTEKSRMLFD
jgi:hypothetical protein